VFRGAYIHIFRVKELSKDTVVLYDSRSAEEGSGWQVGMRNHSPRFDAHTRVRVSCEWWPCRLRFVVCGERPSGLGTSSEIRCILDRSRRFKGHHPEIRGIDPTAVSSS